MHEQQDNTNENPVSTLPDFCESTTERLARGALTWEQLQQASEMFAKIFDDFMLKHMADVRLFEGKRLVGTQDSASLGGWLIIDGQRYSLHLTDSDPEHVRQSASGLTEFRDSERIMRSLNLQMIDGAGRGQQSRSYRLGLDGVIRRYDIDNPRTRYRATTDTRHRRDPSSLIAETKTRVDEIRNTAIPNDRLEEDMGLNNQPVSPKELNGLAKSLNKEVFIPHSYR